MERLAQWLRVLALLSAIALTASTTWSIVVQGIAFLGEQRENNRKLQAEAKERQEKSTQEIASRCSIGVDRFEEIRVCIAKEIETYREQNKTSRELDVQQQSANWALGSLGISFGALIVSAFGIWMLRQSLLYTRAAIAVSRDIGHAQVRAYVSITPEIVGCVTGQKIQVTVQVVNEGQSPANNFGYIALVEVRDHPLPETSWPLIVPAEGQKTPKGVLHPKARIVCEAISFEPLTAEDHKSINENGKRRLYIAMVVFYSDMFMEARISTYCSYVELESLQGQPGRKKINFIATAFGNEMT